MLDIPELKSRIKYEETKLFILRVMVALIILYDHVHPVGAFAKGECEPRSQPKHSSSFFSGKKILPVDWNRCDFLQENVFNVRLRFVSGSSVDIKGCIRVLKDHGGGAEGLFNALRYTTKHLNDNNTPKSTKSIVFEDPT